MKTMLTLLLLTVIIASSCGDKVTKTLYGGWAPVAEADSTGVWGAATDKDFLMNVEGKCEDIKVTFTKTGDLGNPDMPMDSAKCYGERNQLSFIDKRVGSDYYDLKLEANKDTLTGTVSIDYVTGRQVHKIKFARISGGE